MESYSSIQPIIDILASKNDDNIVTITPPTNVKDAIDLLLTKGEATFIINSKEIVDVRVESVPGVLIVRVTNPKLPKIPYFPDATGAIQFVEDITTAADTAVTSTAPVVKTVSNFLTWGAPITTTTTNEQLFTSLSEDEIKVGLGVGMVTIGGAYGVSYAYYTKQQQEAENEMNEKKAKMSAAATAAAKKQNMVQKTDNNNNDDNDSSSTTISTKVQKETTEDSAIPKAVATPTQKKINFVDTTIETTNISPPLTKMMAVVEEAKTVNETTNNNDSSDNNDDNNNDSNDTTSRPKRKRDALKNLFRRDK
jgi:CBS domain-containing protein